MEKTLHETTPSENSRDTPPSNEGGHVAASKGAEALSSSSETEVSAKTLRKIDLHVMPAIFVIYIMAFLDRANLGNALLFSLEDDLGLEGLEVNIALCIFLVAYVAFEIPMTILMKKVTPHVFLSICAFCFGLFTIIQGLVHNYGGLLAIRFFLGIAEAGVYPGSYYLMSMWYKRHQSQKRFTLFFAGASFAGAFGGLLAAAIGNMDGYRGWHAWRWIFIWEGLITCVIATIAFFTIADFPEHVKWLTEEERSQVVNQLAAEQGDTGVDVGITSKGVVKVLSDWKLLLGAPLYLFTTMPVNGLAYFLPSIINTYGNSRIQTQLLSVGPWAASLVTSVIVAFASDQFRNRYLFIAGSLGLSLIGMIMLLSVHTNHQAQYAGVFLMLMGTVSATPVTICWYAMNLRGHQERAIGIPWMVGFGNAAGIVAVFAFPKIDAPRYVMGYSLSLAFVCMAIAIATVYYARCRYLNSKSGNLFYLL